MRRRVAAPGELIAPTSIPVPGEVRELAAWLVDGAGELMDAVRTVGADQPVWNFTGNDQRAGFWLRRMAHETAVHRCDAALSLDEPCAIDAGLAADGISEWLTLVTSPGAAAARPEAAAALRGQGQTLHLHATDSLGLGASGEWLIRRDPDAVTWQHGHQKADVAIRGLASDLLLVLLRRIPPTDERIDVLGDAALFEHWRCHVTF